MTTLFINDGSGGNLYDYSFDDIKHDYGMLLKDFGVDDDLVKQFAKVLEYKARQAIADQMLEVYNDETLPKGLRDMYPPMIEKVLDGSDCSFATLQRIEYLMTGICRPLLP
jgi:hypothetical protein